MATGDYVTELAKSGAAKCRLCETSIPKGSLRVGKLLDGDWGLQTRWYHLHCLVVRVDSIDDIDGAAELSAEHRAALLARIEESRDEVDEEAVPVDPDAIVRSEWRAEAEPPKELLLPLLPYQREGLAWLLHQERESEMLGGILADEMGMGKTIQAIALLLANRRNTNDPAQTAAWDRADMTQGVERSKPRGGTLVVVPVVAMGQWQAEIARFTSAGALRVKIFHGAGRAEDLRAFAEADVVLTSYKTLEAAYRKQTAGTKVECSVCGRKFYAEKLRVHRTYFCGENARRTAAQAKQQRKGRGRDSATTREDLSDESGDSEEDEVDRQKRLLKEMKERSNKSKGKARGRGKAIAVDDSEEDEVDRQKRLLKEMKEQSNKSKGKARARVKTIAVDDSEEDEVDRQKRLLKEMKEQGEGGKRKRVSTSRSQAPPSKAARTEVVEPSARVRARAPRRASSAVKSYRERSVDSESEEWSGTSQSSDEEDSEASLDTENSSDDEEDSESSDVVIATPSANRRQRGSRMLGRAQVVIDHDVERDIQAAQKKAPKAVASPLHKVRRLSDRCFFNYHLFNRRSHGSVSFSTRLTKSKTEAPRPPEPYST